MHAHNRRQFLRTSATAISAAALQGCATSGSPGGRTLRIQLDTPNDALVARTFTILKDRIEHRCATSVIATAANPDIILTLDSQLPEESFRFEDSGKALRIAAGSPRGLLYGAGRLLRSSEYDGPAFRVSAWRGTDMPRGTVRGMYFASHFHNWYHQASAPEIARYMEDLALWGANAVMVIFPFINLQGWDDPQAPPAMNLLRQYARSANELGLQFATGLNNAFFINAPKEIRATPLPDPLKRRGNSGHPICPSIAEGHAYIMDNTRQLYEELADVGLDILVLWPYDEGGCACEQCAPWGSNAYLRLSRDQVELGRKYFPAMKSVLSTWMFDTPPEGEWQGLTEYVANDGSWLDYILADAHEDYPRYPLDVGVPGKLPLLNFPEISMWGNWPWGGYGANVLPARYQRLWDQVSNVVEGGFPYSEGIYEDMHKAIVLQFYWDRDKTARATLKEYVAYEFGLTDSDSVASVLTIIDLLERTSSNTYQKLPVDTADVLRAAELASLVDAELPEWARSSWRWEILRLRTILDRERFAGDGLESSVAEHALLRLIELYHSEFETDDPYHHRVRPPLKRAIDRNGRK
ncbi:MAG TPA: hypothetical protein PLJ47_01285 [Candidatus Hydrogenedentes bacterium]|nr:hypothetical protein [Candidatus Hydrogenedentota bacterium]HRK33198.1 hypothetical protein [Candidatus Hydrogenedentota bacterium]